MIFSDRQIQQLQALGIDIADIEHQYDSLNSPFKYIELSRPASIGDGIYQLKQKDIDTYLRVYDLNFPSIKMVKFVPASGEASRMFNALVVFLNAFDSKREPIKRFLEKHTNLGLLNLIDRIHKVSFYRDIDRIIQKKYLNFDAFSKIEKFRLIAKVILEKEHLGFSFKPKALIPFYKKNDKIFTPIELHLLESLLYVTKQENQVLTHFTIDKRHKDLIKQHIDDFNESHLVPKEVKVKFDLSYQLPKTNSIFLNSENQVVLNSDETFSLRPSGHGSLLENLNKIDAHLIFIRNIDNVLPTNKMDEAVEWKKILAGMLLDIQSKCFDFLNHLDSKITISELKRIIADIEQVLKIEVPKKVSTFAVEKQKEYLKRLINRPIRVCGMVRNKGRVGGGPFFIKNPNGNISLQIVESSQIDKKNFKQLEVFNKSSHFNPVDIVCGIKDYKNKKFNILEYQDSTQNIIAHKTYRGQPIKIFELPGLWNGGMARWLSYFVEIPLSTFNPVKDLNDLIMNQDKMTEKE